MKKTVLLAVLFFSLQALAFSAIYEDLDPQGLSLKAGPTDPSEAISIAWVESALYPKNVEKGKELFVEVKLTSKVKNVFVQLDFEKNDTALYSDDGTSWNKVCKAPKDITSGVHVAKITIEGPNGKKITRTLDFAVIDSEGKTAEMISYPISVIKSTPVIENGEIVRQILPGIKVTALYKAPFYRVQLSDGKEGWVEASNVKDPAEEFYLMGYKAFKMRDYAAAKSYYAQALQIEPNHEKAKFWLSKTYLKEGNIDKAASELRKLAKKNPDFQGSRELAQYLAKGCYKKASSDIKKNDFKSASYNLKLTVELMPEMFSAWIKLGEALSKMGDYNGAQIAWAEALKLDPDNQSVKALFSSDVAQVVKDEKKVEKPNSESASVVKTNSGFTKNFVREAINVVQNSQTSKGTLISSAMKSVLSLTRSLGTKIQEDGWNVRAQDNGFLVRYACRQERSGKSESENFDWKMDPDSRKITALSENAKLLMSRW